MKGESEQSGARQWPRQSGRALGVTFSAVTVFALLALGGVLLRSLAGLGQEAEQQPPGAQPALCPKRAAISVGFQTAANRSPDPHVSRTALTTVFPLSALMPPRSFASEITA